MRRRGWLSNMVAAVASAWPLLAAAQPRHRISATQLQQVLARRFPVRHDVAGLLELQVQAPQLRFLSEQNRLGSELMIEATGPALRRAHTGTIDLDLDFALRYEPADMTVRAHQIRVHAVRLPSLSRDAAALIDAYARVSAERALLEVVLHTLQPQDLALADTMGFEPGRITVVPDGLLVEFIAKPR